MKKLVSDELWAAIEPLLPRRSSGRGTVAGGRPAVDDRAALTGILFVLRSGIPWTMLPAELGCGSGITCWRRLRDWQAAGVWARLHKLLLQRLAQAHKIDWSRASIDARSLPAKRGGEHAGPNPTDRSRPGSKHHLLVDGSGIPLAVALTAANRNECKLLAPVLDAVPPLRSGGRGRPRRRPAKLHADKAYDHGFCRRQCRARHVQPRIARRGVDSSERLGRHRWVVERTIAWLARYRRLTVRYDRRADIHQAWLYLACSLICLNYLNRF